MNVYSYLSPFCQERARESPMQDDVDLAQCLICTSARTHYILNLLMHPYLKQGKTNDVIFFLKKKTKRNYLPTCIQVKSLRKQQKTEQIAKTVNCDEKILHPCEEKKVSPLEFQTSARLSSLAKATIETILSTYSESCSHV